MASWWRLLFRSLVRVSMTLKLTTTTTMATPMVSFDWVFDKLLGKVTFLLYQGNKVFDFWMMIRSQNLKTMNHLKKKPWFLWKPSLLHKTQFWTSFKKRFTWVHSEKGNRVLLGGGGGGALSCFYLFLGALSCFYLFLQHSHQMICLLRACRWRAVNFEIQCAFVRKLWTRKMVSLKVWSPK